MRAALAVVVAVAVACSSAEAGSPPSTLRATTTTAELSPVTVLLPTTTSPATTAAQRPVERPTPPTVAPAVPRSTSTTAAPNPVPVAAPTSPPGSVEQIIRAAAAEFGVSGDLMVRIARCESGLNPAAVNASSGALGLFQHLPNLWGARAAGLGYGYESWSDPTANARVSAVLLRDGGPGHWRACL
jgi:soluble lytic murein transglycosylase-like protein